MLPFCVTIPASVSQRSEIPEGIMNYPVLSIFMKERRKKKKRFLKFRLQYDTCLACAWRLPWLQYVFFIFCPEEEFLSFLKRFVRKPWPKPLCIVRLFVTTTITMVTDSRALLSVCSHYFNLLTTWTVVWKTAEVSTSGAVNLNPPPSYSFVSYCPPFPLPLPLRWTTYASTGCLKNCNVKRKKHEDLDKEWSRKKQEMLIFILISFFFIS